MHLIIEKRSYFILRTVQPDASIDKIPKLDIRDLFGKFAYIYDGGCHIFHYILVKM